MIVIGIVADGYFFPFHFVHIGLHRIPLGMYQILPHNIVSPQVSDRD